MPTPSIHDDRALTIRVAAAPDIETLFDIRTSVLENAQSREDLARLGITPESVRRMLETDCCAWLAELGDRAIGFSFANASESLLFCLFVRPGFEGRGAGRVLLQVAETWLWEQGAAEIWLLTDNNPSLRAYGFYQRSGWVPVGVVQDGAYPGDMKFVKSRPASPAAL